MTQDELVAELYAHASSLGVETGYWDVSGHWHAASVEAIIAVLTTMGAPIVTLADAAGSLRRHVLERDTRVLAPVITVVGDEVLGFELCLPEGTEPWSARVEVTFEDGGVQVCEVTLADLQTLAADEVDLLTLKAAGLVRQLIKTVKVIKSGELTRKVVLKGIGATAGAKAAIEAAGGALA